MRLYTFINFYLSSIQAGIQSAHIQGEITNKVFTKDCGIDQELMIRQWATQYKTIICCNGGNNTGINNLIDLFRSSENPYPWAFFNEDVASMDGMLTGVGIILPEEVYDAKFEPETQNTYNYYTYISPDDCNKQYVYAEGEDYQYELIKRIKSAPLAR